MCWNATVSLNTFTVGVAATSLAVLNNYPWYFVLFFLSFVSMQLVEYFTWKYYSNKTINSLATFVGFVLICLQPLAACLLLYEKNKPLMVRLMIAYVISFLIGLIIVINTSKNPLANMFSYKGTNGHLVWSWISKDHLHYYVLFVYMVFFFVPLFLSGRMDVFALALITLLFSIYFFWKYDTWGTMWCWIVNIASLAMIAKIMFFSGTICTVN